MTFIPVTDNCLGGAFVDVATLKYMYTLRALKKFTNSLRSPQIDHILTQTCPSINES